MPVDQNAANSYEQNADGSAWSDGVSDADIEGGLADAGVSNVRGSGMQQAWEDGVDNQQDAYEEGVDGSSWLEGMSDASDWNV